MSKSVKTAELFDCDVPYLKELFKNSEYPWEMLPKIKDLAEKLVNDGIDGFTEYKKGVLIGKNVKIYDTATIIPPAVIGDNTEVRPGAFIRGSVITGKNCVIGNSTELKNTVMLDNVQVPHYNYLGDTVMGNFSHTGAGTICSNLKSDGKNVVIHGDKEYETGLRKIGGILADKANIGCGCVLNPGTVIGKDTSVYPLTSVRGVIPSNSIVKSTDNVVEKH